jgi:ribosomal 50S subunit-recycling heat shock protein
MAGQLDSLLKKVAKQVVSDLGSSLDTTISYTKKGVSSYNIETGEEISIDTTFSNIKVPIEFIRSQEETGQEMRQAKLYITPDQINNNQINLNDEIKLNFDGADRLVQIVNIDTRKGGQVYLYTVFVRF